MNLPNLITVIRIFLAVGVVVAYLEGSTLWRQVAVVAFLVAAASDWLDGFLARKLNLVTNFGKLMDPLADKILIAGGLVVLTAIQAMPPLATFLILFREFAVSGLRQLASEKDFILAADSWGKWKTAIQIVVVFVLMVEGVGGYFDVSAQVTNILVSATVAITLYSGGRYFWTNRALLKA